MAMTSECLRTCCLLFVGCCFVACDRAAESKADKQKEEPRQSFVIKVEHKGKPSFEVLASIPESWKRKPVAQGLSTALFEARKTCGSFDQDAPDHAIALNKGLVTQVQTNVGVPPSCFAAALADKTLIQQADGAYSGTIYLRTRVDR